MSLDKKLNADFEQMDSEADKINAKQAELLDKVDEVRISCNSASSQLSAVLNKISSENNGGQVISSTEDVNKAANEILLTENLKVASEDLHKLNELNTKYVELSKLSTSLQQQLKALNSAVNTHITNLEELKQYLKLDNLLFHKFPLPTEFLTKISFHKWVAFHINLMMPNLEEPVTWCHIKAAHPLKTRNKSSKVVIVRFNQRGIRDDIYSKKWILKTTGVSVTEHLVPSTLNLLKKAREVAGFRNAWTNDCRVFALINGVQTLIKSENDLTCSTSDDNSRTQRNVRTTRVERKKWSPPVPPGFYFKQNEFPTMNNAFNQQHPFQAHSSAPPNTVLQGPGLQKSTIGTAPPPHGYQGGGSQATY